MKPASYLALLLACVCTLSSWAQTAPSEKPPEAPPVIVTRTIQEVLQEQEAAASTTPPRAANSIRNLAGFRTKSISANDDGSAGNVTIGFTVNFFGTNFTTLAVNNNGNLTFDGTQSAYRPYGLVQTTRKIIAPFFADVDTRGAGSGLVYYGNDTVDGHNAFGVIYDGVGYFASHVDKKNTFQVILIDRSDTGPGNFDIEFDYNSILWDYTDTSTSAAVGYSAGTGAAGTYYEFPGSLTTGAFLDSGPSALVKGSRNSNVLGRYVFPVRNGAVCTFQLSETSRAFISGGSPAGGVQFNVTASPSSCTWTAVSNNSSWLHVLSPSTSVTGSGAVKYTVDSTSAARTGTLSVAGQTYTVQQASPPAQTGALTVYISPSGIAPTFELFGPSYYRATGTSLSVPVAPAGSYRIVYGPLAGYVNPPPETKTLAAGGSTTFTGTYSRSCVAPTIQTNPADTTVTSGSSAQLTVVANGLAPLTYQWYQGTAGTTTTPVGQNSPSFITPRISASTKYWVNVGSSCGSVNSTAATVTPATLSFYSDKAWAYRVSSDPIKVYKAPGDLIDFVVQIKNDGAQSTTDVQLSLDATLFDPSFPARAFRRGSITELANKANFHTALTPADSGGSAGTRTLRLAGQTLYTTSAANPANEFIFRVQLKTPLANATLINPSVTAAGQSNVPLLNRNRVEIRNKADIILTNNKLLYRTYGTNAGDTLDDTLASQVNQLWESVVATAEARVAIIYCVDDFESPSADRSTVSTVKWEDTRKTLPYDSNPNTSTTAEETAVNAVSHTIDGLLQGWITKLGGSSLNEGRYILIVGGDRVIPYYRTFEPMLDLRSFASGYYNASNVTIADASNNYFFTDMLYRNTDGTALWRGSVQNVFVGRIDGLDPNTLVTMLRSTTRYTSSSSNVVKLENYRRNGSLDAYQTSATAVGYNVVTSTPNPGSVTLDFQPTPTQFANKTGDDPARWANLLSLFQNTRFDLWRSICHGSLNGLYNSEDKYYTYMDGDNIRSNRSALQNSLSSTNPIFVLDSCLNGLLDFDGTSKPNSNHLVHQLFSVGPRAVIASTGITYSNNISDYNTLITNSLFSQNPIGSAMNNATRSYGQSAQWRLGQFRQIMAKTLLQMNLFGAPWSRIVSPNSRASASSFKPIVERAATDALEPIVTIGYSAGSPAASMQKSLYLTVGTPTRRDADTVPHHLIDIPGFTQLHVDETTPVLPYKEINLNLPLDAYSSVSNGSGGCTGLAIDFRNPDTATLSGVTNLGGFKRYFPTFPLPAGWSDGYVDLGASAVNFDASYECSAYKTSQFTVVSVRAKPLKWTASTKKADLYTTVAGTLNYTTNASGILTSFTTDADRYFPGATAQASAGLENTSPSSQSFTVTISVLDGAGNAIASSAASQTAAYDSAAASSTTVAFPVPTTPGAYTVNVSVTDGSSTVIGTDSKSIQVDAAPYVDMAVSLTASNTGTTPGSTYTYNVSVANNGAYDASGVFVGDTLPAGLSLVSATPTVGSCSGTTSIGCNLGVLPNGVGAAITIVATGTVAGPFANRVTVSANERDPNPTNNLAGQDSASSGSATIAIDRARLVFGATNNGAASTTGEDILVSISGGSGVNWTAIPDKTWIVVTPSSGTGNGRFTVTIAAAGLAAGLNSGNILIQSPGTSNTASVRVELNVVATGASASPIINLDTPLDNSSGLASNIPVTGWALDDVGIDRVEIWRDPNPGEPTQANGLAYIGVANLVVGTRPDVEAAYPNMPYNQRAGWGYMLLTNFLPASTPGGTMGNGRYKIYAIAYDKEGKQSRSVGKTITVDNLSATKPFGTIDTPGQGETISNNPYVNFGWALTPRPASIPIDGSTISMWVDGVNLGQPTYNNYRVDIATLFPNYINKDGAVGYKYMDLSTLSNGVHTIYWVVTDNLNRTDGIGSRYFTAISSGSSRAAAPTAEEEIAMARFRPAVRLPRVARDREDQVEFRTGYNQQVPLEPLPAAENGLRHIRIEQLDRIELHLPASPGGWRGAMLVLGEERALPVGSSWDPDQGAFYWQLGPAGLGEYDLVFEPVSSGGELMKVPIHVTVAPLRTAAEREGR